jgi:hypothetical protein
VLSFNFQNPGLLAVAQEAAVTGGRKITTLLLRDA